jgi:hypothetical protein
VSVLKGFRSVLTRCLCVVARLGPVVVVDKLKKFPNMKLVHFSLFPLQPNLISFHDFDTVKYSRKCSLHEMKSRYCSYVPGSSLPLAGTSDVLNNHLNCVPTKTPEFATI